MTLSFSPTLQDPALSARTFSNNPTLTRALDRIRQTARCETPTPTPEPVISGAEVDGSDSHDPLDADRPSDEELNRHYLLVNGWEPRFPDQWFDPISDLIVSTPFALGMQSARDFRDSLAEQPTEQK